MRIHYNFCREHSTLGKTPAEASAIKIHGEYKLLTLIQNANSSGMWEDIKIALQSIRKGIQAQLVRNTDLFLSI